MRKLILVLAGITLFATGCASENVGSQGSRESVAAVETEMTSTESAAASKEGYTHISQDEAKKIMEEETGYLIVDVRTEEEYVSGHIPGAVNVPLESIGESEPEKLTDKNQKLLLYCRSGRRSQEAAEKLSKIGYTEVYEFGGIKDWTGETVQGEEAAE